MVTKDIPPYAIAVGNPIRIVKYRFSPEICHKLNAIKWWNWPTEKIWEYAPLMEHVEDFVDKFYSPELEQFPEDEVWRQVEQLRKEKYNVYTFVADFQSKNPLWQRIVRGFFTSFQAGNKIGLVIIADESASEENIQELQDNVNMHMSESGLKEAPIRAVRGAFLKSIRRSEFPAMLVLSARCPDPLW